jgi:uncharacterized glyoxalase superfamily protein PhnB
VKKRSGDPWMPAVDYGSSLPAFMANLLVRDVKRSVQFYTRVLSATLHYADPDFAALRVGEAELMLHADHTYEDHPLHHRLTGNEPRGIGVELRLFGIDPDGVEARARVAGASIIMPATTKAHGWREMWLQDPDGYVWAIGVAS